jgi:hypothetical protein
MNNDPFEDQLRGQPLRHPPADWRKDILAAAARQVRHDSPSTSQPSVSWWRTLLWPAPQAWAGLAAVWVAILAFHFFSTETPASVQMSETSPRRQVEYALHLKNQLIAEVLSEMDTNMVAEQPKRFVPQPRSEGVPTMVFV